MTDIKQFNKHHLSLFQKFQITCIYNHKRGAASIRNSLLLAQQRIFFLSSVSGASMITIFTA